MMNKYTILFVIVILGHFPLKADNFYQDEKVKKQIKTTIDLIYNFQFEAADSAIAKLKPSLGYHPGWEMLRGFKIFWKYQPLRTGTKAYTDFEGVMKKVLKKCIQLREDENYIEADFFEMAANGYLTELYANNNENFKALGIAKNIYSYVKNGFELQTEIPEYYFTSGLYNYYRVKYPEENPFFKPFMWFFMAGDKEEGIAFLKEGREKAVFTQVECINYLFHIYLRYEGDPQKSYFYASELIAKFPNNFLYQTFYLENLYCLKHYFKMQDHYDMLASSNNNYYKFLGLVFRGIYLEKAKGEYNAALLELNKAEQLLVKLPAAIPHYNSYLYAAKGRIHAILKQPGDSDKYFKKALSESEYSTVTRMIIKDMQAF